MRRVITSLIVLGLLGLGPLWAVPAGVQPVGQITSIDGRAAVSRPGLPTWYAAYSQMPLYVGDQIATDGSSKAIVRLTAGGNLGLDRRTAVHLVGTSRQVQAPSELRCVKVMRGGVWIKFRKLHEPFYITTSRAMVTLTGTELVVEEATDQGSSVEVLEGQVAYAPLVRGDAVPPPRPPASPSSPSPGPSAPQTIKAGTQVTVDSARVATVKTYSADDLRRSADTRFPGLQSGVVREVLGAVSSYVPYGNVVSNFVADPQKAAVDLLRTQTGGSGVVNQAANAVVSIFRSKPDESFPLELSPDRTEANPGQLSFTWRDGARRDRFLVVVSRDDTFQAVDWSGSTETTTLRFPADAMPLEGGARYYWRVVGLDKKGKPKGKASQSYFIVPTTYRPPSTTTDLSNAVGPTDEPPPTAVAPVLPSAPAPPRKHPGAAVTKPAPHPKPSTRPSNPPRPVASPPSSTTKPAAAAKPKFTSGSAPGFRLDPIARGTGMTSVTISGYAWDSKGVQSVTFDGTPADLRPVTSFDIQAMRRVPNGRKFSVSIPLSAGQTAVRVHAVNVDGAAFEKDVPLQGGAPAAATPSPSPEAVKPTAVHPSAAPVGKGGRRFALLVGVSDYQSPDIAPLRFPGRDVGIIRAVLEDPGRGGYPAANVRVLASGGEAPTRANIGKALNWLGANANRPDDTVFIYFSGHGYNDKSGSYLVCADSSLQALNTTAINVSIFNKSIESLSAQRKVVILDACHAGGVDRAARGGGGLSSAQRRDLVLTSKEAKGEVRILSCAEEQVSWEADDLEQGVFSYFLARGLKGEADNDGNGCVTIGELRDYLQGRVARWAADHGKKQTPVFNDVTTDIFILTGRSR